jgi:hypothetical protein
LRTRPKVCRAGKTCRRRSRPPGTDVMIFKKILPKNLA